MNRAQRLPLALVTAWAALMVGCGVEGRQARPAAGESAAPEPDERIATPVYRWPEGSRDVAVLEVAGFGDIRIALYPELAPRTVENFIRLSDERFYDGTTFHRVIPDFMIQGGGMNSKNDDPFDDAYGNPGFTIPDEFTDARHERGTVSMANQGNPDTGTTQFFIVQRARPDLDGHYSVFGRVVAGMDVVDAITRVEVDVGGRWGTRDRPIENVVVERLRIEPDPSIPADASPPSEPNLH